MTPIESAIASLPPGPKTIRANDNALEAASGVERCAAMALDVPIHLWNAESPPTGIVGVNFTAVHEKRKFHVAIDRDYTGWRGSNIRVDIDGPDGGGYSINHPAIMEIKLNPKILSDDPRQLTIFARDLVRHAASIAQDNRRREWKPSRKFEIALRSCLAPELHDNAIDLIAIMAPSLDHRRFFFSTSGDRPEWREFSNPSSILSWIPTMPAALKSRTASSGRDFIYFEYERRHASFPSLDIMSRLRLERDKANLRYPKT